MFSIPNGGKRGKAEAGRLKAEGVLKGVHDLYIPALNLWIEMKKNGGGRVSPDQKKWGDYVESLGHTWFVGHGFEDAKNKTLAYLKNHNHI